jgi:hypothetical protein
MSTPPPTGGPEQHTPGRMSAYGSDVPATGHTNPPAGWYPTPTGGQQYWDGQNWLALPPPTGADGPSASALGPASEPKNRRTVKWLVIAGLTVLLLGLVGGGIAWKAADDARQAEAAAEAAAEKAATEEREAQEREEAAAAAAQERRDQAERDSRRASVVEIEASVMTLAEQHAADGIIEGPIIDVSCSPVGGGSTDDLTEQTTVFECFAAYKDNGDGTMSGWTYNATMNWSSGSYTYGLGAA